MVFELLNDQSGMSPEICTANVEVPHWGQPFAINGAKGVVQSYYKGT
ncbi:MAG: hypothetical protein ACJAWM_001670 [Sulfitobacter sp.]|jgi:hypothetical protein